MHKDLLIEIGTEELPPKVLKKLSTAFTQGVVAGLKDQKLSHGDVRSFASPRRLAITIADLATEQDDQVTERKGPATKAAFDADGNPTKAILGFAKSCGVTIDQLGKQTTDKGEWFVFNQTKAGQQTESLLADIITHSLNKLPTPKRMRWGDNDVEFVRPMHWVIVMMDDTVIDMEIMGISSDRISRGHRFHHPEPISIDSVESYESQLLDAYVIADFEKRRDTVSESAHTAAESLGGQVIIDEELLDEVTALVEWPVAVAGGFEEQYLAVPQECLITTMESHQKYFAVVDNNGMLLPHFITTSNIESKNVRAVQEGNERVIRPRFSDAEFFWQQDQLNPLSSRIKATEKILFQKQLGTLFEKTQRVEKLATFVAEQTGANAEDAARAAQLSKCDLMTDMVGEFPKLQGIMGRYYALQDGETENVAWALEEQYNPRYAGDDLPQHEAGLILSLSDKLDTLMGIFAIGQRPSGTKDPFALRRAALGVLRIIIEGGLDLDLKELLHVSAGNFSDSVKANEKVDETFDYIIERLNAYYKDQGISSTVVDAVAKLLPTRPLDFDQRVTAVASFKDMAEAESLAAANKRIGNILKKQDQAVSETVDTDLFKEAAEGELHAALLKQQDIVSPLFEEGNYTDALKSLADLRDPVDTFFDGVMVIDENMALRENRLALLNQLRNTFLKVADLSVL
ncbi:MAG: Glycyl-tRNA synthetase beta chain (EC [uncultured Thiotrichaceae bacterium]|uniref:Glycine--tRNA ligase beta subunit n=1 Tax=uncultured Thiotrichaceae bacterium TaxID=298394 RepID=A0A6S6TN61_9GAMM|nr:MAG: Glycyl-tRNA synthetase beta chain (EC [uncultured Thiotrichaceae bacterium]